MVQPGAAAQETHTLAVEKVMRGEGANYLLAGQHMEVERHQLQSRVWEPTGRSLLAELPKLVGGRVLDVGCGAWGWLRLLSEHVGRGGQVIGSDVDEKLLDAAEELSQREHLTNVTLLKDDLFNTRLEPHSFDLVHARFMLGPLGRASEQMSAYKCLLKPGGWLVIEDVDAAPWRIHPANRGAERLINLIVEAFKSGGGDLFVGRTLSSLIRSLGAQPGVRAHVLALPPQHPYLRLPLQFAASLEPRLLKIITHDELQVLRSEVERALTFPDTWGTTFMLIQSYAAIR